MKKKKRGPAWFVLTALGMVCALVIGAVFYAMTVYQLDPQAAGRKASPAATPAPLSQGAPAAQLFPGELLSLGGQLQEERVSDVKIGLQTCRVVEREYLLADGMPATAVSAWPAAYMERLAQEGWMPQLITGFTIAGMDAVYERRDGQGLLAARRGACVYMIIAPDDEQALYLLGAQAQLAHGG